MPISKALSRSAYRLACAIALWTTASSAVYAQVVNLPFSATYRGSVELLLNGSTGCTAAYTVPAGLTFRVTDWTLDGYGDPQPLPLNYLCSGKPGCTKRRTGLLTAPVGTTLTQSYTTGIRFETGETLFVCNNAGLNRTVSWAINGFLYSLP